jgi:putative addiction module CopG family antidote
LDPSYSLLDDFEAVKGHVVGNVTRVCGPCSKVAAGRYSSSSEVVREALQPMEKIERQEAEKFQFLRNAWQEGIDSGDVGEPLTYRCRSSRIGAPPNRSRKGDRSR